MEMDEKLYAWKKNYGISDEAFLALQLIPVEAEHRNLLLALTRSTHDQSLQSEHLDGAPLTLNKTNERSFHTSTCKDQNIDDQAGVVDYTLKLSQEDFLAPDSLAYHGPGQAEICQEQFLQYDLPTYCSAPWTNEASQYQDLLVDPFGHSSIEQDAFSQEDIFSKLLQESSNTEVFRDPSLDNLHVNRIVQRPSTSHRVMNTPMPAVRRQQQNTKSLAEAPKKRRSKKARNDRPCVRCWVAKRKVT